MNLGGMFMSLIEKLNLEENFLMLDYQNRTTEHPWEKFHVHQELNFYMCMKDKEILC